MFLSVEKKLLANQYCEIKNSDNNSTIYRNLIDARIQVALLFNGESNKWSLSMPLNGCDFNYVTYWKEANKIKLYALDRICVQ